jgi:hypothetical protein
MPYKIVFREGPTLLVSNCVNHISPLRTVYTPGEWASNPHGPLYCYREPPNIRLGPGEHLWECEVDGVVARVGGFVVDYGYICCVHGPELVKAFHGDEENYNRCSICIETDDGPLQAPVHQIHPILMAKRIKLIRLASD